MSSGNPFRASQAFPRPAPVPQTSFINTDSSVLEARRGDSDYVLEDAAAPPTKTKKSVRIVSPTTTIPPQPDFDDENATLNELMARRASQGRPASPPPPITPAGVANHSVTAGEANAQVIGKDALVTAGALPSARSYPSEPQRAPTSGYVPANPFSKTLASLEQQEGEGGTGERTNAQRPAPGNNRASLDVESFKNLLMTGSPTPRTSGQSPQFGSTSQSSSSAQFESSSTDTSSVSRQSISDHPQETHADSSRTSDDMADEEEHGRIGRVLEAKKDKKKPPPAPKHRHGKLVAPRQPQTVAFDEFEATEPTPGIRRTSSSDVNRPLPSTPAAQKSPPRVSSQDNIPLQSRPTQPRPSEVPKSSEDQAKPKKTPPPVPIARRHSQLKTTSTGNRSRSSSNLTISSQYSIEAPPTPTSTSHDPMSSAKSPPPPPPSRHGARLANLGNSSTNSSSTELAASSSSARTPRSIPDAPSPRRNNIDSEASSPAPSVHRTSSVSSSRNMQRNVSGGSTGSNMPPPPPPRRRQSNRSSLDQPRPQAYTSSSPTESRRTSTEYRRASTEQRRTSVASESSLRRSYAPVDEKSENEFALYSPVDEKEKRLGTADEKADTGMPETTSSSSNILDDMEKFQREIDELRTRYKQ